MLTQKILSFVFSLITLILITSCSGANESASVLNEPLLPLSQIPTTTAVTPIAALSPKPLPPASAAPTQAILRHVHRNTVSGISSPNGEYLDSDNAKVEKRGLFGWYYAVDRQADKRYVIELEDNGLAYFRVTNTKANGSVRVHNFYGVAAGYYMSFDPTDVDFQPPENPLTQCRSLDIRLNNLPSMLATSRILVNGKQIFNAIVEQDNAYLKQVNLCPVDLDKNYLAMVVIENSPADIRYGFNFYNNLAEADFLEIDISEQAEVVAWTSDYEIGNEFNLYGIQYGWQKYLLLYSSSAGDNFSGTLPKFSQLALSSYRFFTDTSDLSAGIDMTWREFDPTIQQLDLAINNIKFADLTVTPLDLSWNSVGVDQANVVSAIVFNSSLTQTYAFISMDSEVLSAAKFTYPLDDLPLVLDSTLVATTGAAGINNGSSAHISQAALYAGFLYWPNEQTINSSNSDLFITANGTALLPLVLAGSFNTNLTN
jgi:hypothetical protein